MRRSVAEGTSTVAEEMASRPSCEKTDTCMQLGQVTVVTCQKVTE